MMQKGDLLRQADGQAIQLLTAMVMPPHGFACAVSLHYLLFKNAFGLTMTSSFQLTKRKNPMLYLSVAVAIRSSLDHGVHCGGGER